MTDELLAALGAVRDREEPDGGWLSRREIMEMLNLPKPTALERLRALHEAGRLEVRRMPRLNLIGEWQRVPCYRLKSDTIDPNV